MRSTQFAVSVFVGFACLGAALQARAQALPCKADHPADAYRAIAAALPMAERANDTALRAKLIRCRGNAREFDGRVPEAEADYLYAAALAAQAKDPVVESDARSNAAFVQYSRGAMADALANAQISYRLSAGAKYDNGRREALSLMANVYADRSVAQYDRAIEYYRQLAAEYEKNQQRSEVGDTLFNIGSTYEQQGTFAAAESNYRRALAVFEQLQQPKDVAYTKRALGSMLTKEGRAKESIHYFDEALAVYEQTKDRGNAAHVRQSRGIAYHKLGRADEALRDLAAAEAYFEMQKNTRFLEKNIDEMASVYEQVGDWRSAYLFRTRHAALQQELATARRDEMSSRLRIEFDAAKKEQENRALARENSLRVTALQEAERSQKLQFAVMTLTALLAVALGLLFWRQVVNTRRMRAMAMTDELTRLPNRRHILAALDIAFAEAKRRGEPVTLIVLDIDRFKRINDTFGHAAGDEILRMVARTCRLALRPSDQIGRIGGEEFLIVLQAPASAQQASEVAERIRAAVERLDVSGVADGLPQVTISLGVFVTTSYDAKNAIAAADALLYRAKESGRNRVEIAVASIPD